MNIFTSKDNDRIRLRPKKILITGHRGFIGRHILASIPSYCDVTCIDIQDGDDAIDFFREDNTRFDQAFHCAAYVGGRKGIDNTPLKIATNVALDSWYFQWLAKSQTRHGIYYSSSAAYPTEYQLQPMRLKESDIDLAHPRRPDEMYGWVKLTGEIMAQYAESQGCRVHIFRPFSGYGTDQDLDYPFPSFIERAMEQKNPFEIWGNGNQVRDWIHVDDIVQATHEAVLHDIKGPINLGSGQPTTFNELADIVCKAVDYKPKKKYISEAPTGVSYRCSDNEKMLSFYEPKITLEMGVERAVRGL